MSLIFQYTKVCNYQQSLNEHVSTDSFSCFSLEKTNSVILHVFPPEFKKRSRLKMCSDTNKIPRSSPKGEKFQYELNISQ